MTDSSRYIRQMTLPQIGAEGQQALSDSSVLIVGAGGLGVPVALYLAGAGIGKITVIDHDEIALSNLHRQVIYTEASVGQYKARILAEHLNQLNSEIKVEAITKRLSSNNAKSLCESHDIVIDAADNFLTTYLLSDLCYALNKPLVSASVIGCEGYVGVFCGGSPSYRALFPTPPEQANTCSEAGVLAPIVGLIGMVQAQETIKLCLQSAQGENFKGETLQGKLQITDLWENRTSKMDFSGATEPENAKTIDLLLSNDLTDSDYIVDVRNSDEIAENPVKSDLQIPIDDFVPESIKTEKQRLVFFCASGKRATRAALMMQQVNDKDLGVLFIN